MNEQYRSRRQSPQRIGPVATAARRVSATRQARQTRQTAPVRSIIAAVMALLAALSLTACATAGANGTNSPSAGAGQSQTQTATPPPGSAAAAGANGRLGANLNDYIDNLLRNPYLSDYERPIIEQAKRDGGISASTYEKVWADYKSCMADRGYKGIQLHKWPNGIYDEYTHAPGTPAQEEKWRNDWRDCFLRFEHVESLYGAQQSNPSLYADIYEAAVDCMRREGVVPMSFTVSDYNKVQGKSGANATVTTAAGEQVTVNMRDPIVRGCKAAAGMSSSFTDDPMEYLW